MGIMHRLTLRSMKMNKSRSIVTLIGIILAMALITIAANFAESAKRTEENYFQRLYGNYDVNFNGEFTDDDVKKLEANRKVDSVYLKQSIGVAPFENSISNFRNRIVIDAYSKNAFEKCFDFALEEGHFPQNADEIVLSQNFVNYSEKKYKAGDKITLELGYLSETGTDDTGEPWEICLYNGTENTDMNKNYRYCFTKTYTVSGILAREIQEDDENASYNNYVNVYTYTDFSDHVKTVYDKEHSSNDLYVLIKNRSKENSIQFVSDYLKIDRNNLGDFSQTGYLDWETTELNETGMDVYYCGINLYLYEYSGLSENITFYAGLVIIVIIMAASVFIIKNSFSISVTEKLIMYGRISGIGASAKQIRNSVFFEAFILGIIGIPIGLFIGIGGTAAVLNLSEAILSDIISRIDIVFGISWISLICAVLLGIITIFLSALSASIRASRVTPIEAIRQNKNISTDKKVLKMPKWVYKIFGAGGKLAYKNMKRNKKQYHTIVMSIFVSILIFISTFSFINYTLISLNIDLSRQKSNMEIWIENSVGDSDENMTLDDKNEFFMNVADYDETADYVYMFENNDYYFDIPSDKIPESCKGDNIQTTFVYMTPYREGGNAGSDISDKRPKYDGVSEINTNIIAYDDHTYNLILDRLGYNYNEMKDKGILVNCNEVYIGEDEEHVQIESTELMKEPVGYDVNMYTSDTDEWKSDGTPENTQLTIEIGGVVNDYSIFDDTLFSDSVSTNGIFIVSMEWYKNNYSKFTRTENSMLLFSNDTNKTEERLNNYSDFVHLNNFTLQEKQFRAVSGLIGFFVYGLIIMISLIGITNVFNTITTNTKLRQKEYAMLFSIGMTKKEFNRMAVLECLFYTIKSVILGVIGGLLVTAGIYYYYYTIVRNAGLLEGTAEKGFPFIFPWTEIIVCGAVVIAVILLIIAFSSRKIHKQNIIETIRNDNI